MAIFDFFTHEISIRTVQRLREIKERKKNTTNKLSLNSNDLPQSIKSITFKFESFFPLYLRICQSFSE